MNDSTQKSAASPASFPRLARALGLERLEIGNEADELKAIAAFERLRRDCAPSVVAAIRSESVELQAQADDLLAELDAVRAGHTGQEIDRLIANAYRDGKLARLSPSGEQSARERLLRMLGAEDVVALRAEITAMPKVVPVGERH